MNDTVAQDLVRKKCAPCEGGVAPLTAEQIRPMLKGLPGWTLDGKAITRTYRFKNYFETMAFAGSSRGNFTAAHIKTLRLLLSDNPPAALQKVQGIDATLDDLSPLIRAVFANHIRT